MWPRFWKSCAKLFLLGVVGGSHGWFDTVVGPCLQLPAPLSCSLELGTRPHRILMEPEILRPEKVLKPAERATGTPFLENRFVNRAATLRPKYKVLQGLRGACPGWSELLFQVRQGDWRRSGQTCRCSRSHHRKSTPGWPTLHIRSGPTLR